MKTETYEIDNDELSKNYRLALISDIHLKNKLNPVYYKSMIDTLEKINPDYITLAGDYFYGVFGRYTFWHEESRKHLLYYLHSFRELAPVVMSLGNHDIERIRDKEKRKHFKSLASDGIYPLDNENIVLDDFNFMGYIPPKIAYSVDRIHRINERIIVEDIKSNIFEIKSDKMNILLSHLPNILRDEYIMKRCPELYQFDLVLSGHHHGGLNEKQEKKLNTIIDRLVEIKLLKKHKDYLESLRYAGVMLVALNRIPCISKTTRGMHEVFGTTMIIGRGAKPTRGLDDSYITEIKLRKTK